jgi:tRNA threonylcarbamoyladenosine biosynthesis protein TsaB
MLIFPAILAIETSAELASAALLHGERVFSREASGVMNHSQTILPMVQALLAEAGLTLAECAAIGFGIGPGSFTGVRTACGIVQGLAFGAALPVVPVVTLLAMAEACRERTGVQDVLAVLDARMGEVYWAQYRYHDGWHEVIAPTLSAPADVVPQGSVQACGNGFAAYATGFAGAPFAAAALAAIMPHAAQVARLAKLEFAQGRMLAAADAQPLYLRNNVALTINERLAKAAAAV